MMNPSDQGLLDFLRQRVAIGASLPTVPRAQSDKMPRVGRNDPCPCGSGNRYKECHGKLS
jgi:uncharacterized protein YecA (UPF0149 family)